MNPTEHILLETEPQSVPQRHEARRAHGGIALHSRLHRRALSLEIIDDYYLWVCSEARRRELEFTLDLRFVRTPRLLRHVAWRSLAASLLLAALAAGTARLLATGHWHSAGLWVCLALAAAAACAMLACIYRTTETFSLFSTYGAARLVEFTGGLGTLRTLRPFLRKLEAHMRLAAGARRAKKAEHLRDEMREHLRLKESGVLSVSEYEASKARILGAHAAGSA